MSGQRSRGRNNTRPGMTNGRVVTERPKTAVTQKPGKPLTLDARFTMLNQLRGQASQRQAGAREAKLAQKRGFNPAAKPVTQRPQESKQQVPAGKKPGKRKGQKLRGSGQRPTSPAFQLAKAKRKPRRSKAGKAAGAANGKPSQAQAGST